MAELLNGNISTTNINPLDTAKYLMKKSVNIGEAVVNVLGNTGIAGFKFHVPQGEQVNMENDITDFYIDTNSVIQDHIARKPITITVNGFQGEYYYTVHPIENILSKVTPTLALVKQFLPKISPVTAAIKRLQARKNEIPAIKVDENGRGITTYKNNFFDNDFSSLDLFLLFQDIYKLKSAQTRAFLFFEALWRSNALFTVETTWKKYDRMVIQKITPLRDNNADITDFSITFKQISITESKSESIKSAAGRLKSQISPVTKKGIDKGQEINVLSQKSHSDGVTGSW